MSVRGLRCPRRTKYSLVLIRANLWLILARSFQVHARQAGSTSSSRRTMTNRTSLGKAIDGDVIVCATGRVLMSCLVCCPSPQRKVRLPRNNSNYYRMFNQAFLAYLDFPHLVFIDPCELENHTVWSNSDLIMTRRRSGTLISTAFSANLM